MSSLQQTSRADPLRTEVLRHTQLLCGPGEVLDTRGDETPLHERCPEKDRLRAWMDTCEGGRSRFWVSADRAGRGGGLLDAPAGWFMNAVSFDAPADDAAPDMVAMFTVRRMRNGRGQRGGSMVGSAWVSWESCMCVLSFPGCYHVRRGYT